ncbi:MAG: hypothetical protein H6822_07765 [Planctomycetaceae bacterium]|nr:hypothetical protein [Planctomycetales bacterium]MCB9922062.1 hypothetical protein [Planctomycetaceae bacterium]
MIDSVNIRQFAAHDVENVTALWEKTLPSSQPWNDPKAVICRKLNVKDDLFFVDDLAGEIIATQGRDKARRQ